MENFVPFINFQRIRVCADQPVKGQILVRKIQNFAKNSDFQKNRVDRDITDFEKNIFY